MQENFEKYSTEILDRISCNIRKFRDEKGYSQEALAEKAECSREFLNRIENKKENVSLNMLLKLAFVLEVDIVTLFGI